MVLIASMIYHRRTVYFLRLLEQGTFYPTTGGKYPSSCYYALPNIHDPYQLEIRPK